MINGILVINKPASITSRDVVNKLVKIFNTKKIGHTGTLDPLATGVMVVCIGKATKLVDLITAYDKEYEAKVRLGIKTDTLDITGNTILTKEVNVTKEKVNETLLKFKTTYMQEVPIYSAVKINGKKLYEYARSNIEIELPKREVTISQIELLEYNDITFSFKCMVSKGTYIRSLIDDIATSLDNVGVMEELNRTKQGNFFIEDSYTLEDLQNNNYKIITIDEILKDYKTVIVDEDLKFKIINGQIIDNIYDEDIVVFKDKEVLGIYKTYEKDDKMLKPYKMFI